MKFLISRLSALGDTVCSLPVASSLKRAFPDCHISWLVDPRFAEVVECCRAVDQVIRYKFKALERVRFEGRFDVALDLQGLLKSAYPLLWARADQKIGYHWQREGSNFVTQRVLPDPTSFHVVDQYVDVARSIGGSTDPTEFNMVPRSDATTSCKTKLNQNGIVDRFAVINPSAGWVTKRWPPDRFANLIDRMYEVGVQSVLIGGRASADLESSAAVVAAVNCPLADLTGQTSVRELIALVSLCSVHVGGDTGSSHLAAALGKPAVGLYSITNPLRSCPYGWRDYCHYEPAGLSDIEPAEVFETVTRALGAAA
jgi:heptosyltransferase-1